MIEKNRYETEIKRLYRIKDAYDKTVTDFTTFLENRIQELEIEIRYMKDRLREIKMEQEEYLK